MLMTFAPKRLFRAKSDCGKGLLAERENVINRAIKKLAL